MKMALTVNSRIGRRLLILSVTATIIVSSPLLLLIVILLLVVRGSLTIFIKLFKPQLTELLTGMSSVIGSDCPYKNSTMGGIMVGILQGHVPLEKLQQDIKKSFEEFESHKPKPIYTKLKCELTSLMGFCAWKKDVKFCVENHVKILNPVELNDRLRIRTDDVKRSVVMPDEVTMENVAAISYIISMVPFVQGQSPWEILIYHNQMKKKHNFEMITDNGIQSTDKIEKNADNQDDGARTILFFKIHHVLADAPNFYTLLAKLMRNEKFAQKLNCLMSSARPQKERKNCFIKFGQILYFPIGAVHDLFKLFVEGWDYNLWHRGIPKLRCDYQFTSFDILINEIKSIRKIRGDVKFFSVLIAAYTGGFRKYLIRKGLQDILPQVMHTLTSIVKPRDPFQFKLFNDVTGTILTMPTGLNDRDEILAAIEKETKELKSSLAPQGIWIWGYLVGLLPKMFAVYLNFWFVTTCFTANVPGFDEQLFIAGAPWLSMVGIASFPGAQGITIYATSYMDKLTISIGVSRHVIKTPEDLAEFRNCVQQEFEALKDIQNNQVVSLTESTRNMEEKMTIMNIE